ncbi:glycosyltransferase family 2 protein [Oleidesulfovibrio sp.]|uniref:glycosyltransferase family 2 protein n=1 Tax=Oleidesulfovibrio sp. TaxID=2909707 RepID=UPI003A8C6B7A
MASSSPLSVIIPVWNQWNLTKACLESLRQHTPGNFYEVIVTDNGSDDETVSQLESLGTTLFGAKFKRIRLESNLGFGPACNLGAEAASGEKLLFLNNDTLLTNGWLAPLMKSFDEDPRLGAVGPLLLYPDSDRVQHAGIAFTPALRTQHLYANFPASHPVVQVRRNLQAITGACLMLPRKLFMACGGFYKGYKNGSEDLELCSRIRELGKRLTCIPQSKVYHLESQTPGRGDDDDLNAALLNERCKGCFGPDMHKYAARDGYRFAITPWLESYVTLPDEREAELNERLKNGFDAGVCWQSLQEEPLWQTGYVLLASYLEQSGMFVEASGVCLLQTYFFPMLPHYRQLASTAAMAGNADLAEQAIAKVEHIDSLLEDVGALTKKAAGLANWARKAGESDLQNMYEGWLRDLGLL